MVLQTTEMHKGLNCCSLWSYTCKGHVKGLCLEGYLVWGLFPNCVQQYCLSTNVAYLCPLITTASALLLLRTTCEQGFSMFEQTSRQLTVSAT